MNDEILLVVKSVIPSDRAQEFNEYYHRNHIPDMIKMSGCTNAKRFKAIETDDQYLYMATYEFSRDAFNNYQNGEARKWLVQDFASHYGGIAKTGKSTWEKIYPPVLPQR